MDSNEHPNLTSQGKGKRRWVKWAVSGAIVLGALAIVTHWTTARADGWGHRRGMMGIGWMIRDLDLTTDQKHKIAAILTAHKADIVAARQGIVTAGQAMRNSISDSGASVSKLQGNADAIADAGKQMAHVWLAVRGEVMGVLTPAQKQKLADRRQKMLDRIQAHMSEHGSDFGSRLDDMISKLSQ
jgi:Spy/CpxP family protein refolding chaperone